VSAALRQHGDEVDGRYQPAPIPRVLVVDDNEGIRSYLAHLLDLKGFQVDTAEDGRRALELLRAGAAPDVIILDVMMPGIDGLETLRRLRAAGDDTPVVMLSVVGKANTIVESMRLGASDYLNKPFEEEELEATLNAVLKKRILEQERAFLREQLARPDKRVVWQNPAMRKIQRVIEQVADTDVTVLLQGESGVGKEVVARMIHKHSTRKEAPFIKVNCAALPHNLLESELFGYEKGAFTGAVGRRQGKFEAADKGTIFLDEIGEMSQGLQAKLLHVLQDCSFLRVGGNVELHVDVRIICATNRRLEEMVREGRFREDLFFRLNVVNMVIPPLRERSEEILPLIDLFAARSSKAYGRPLPKFSEGLLSALKRYAFPGNIRELENMVKRIVVLGNESTIMMEILQRGDSLATNNGYMGEILKEVEETAGTVPLREVGNRAAREAERQVLERVLFHTSWNRKKAASILNVSYKTLLQKIRETGLEAG